MPKRCHDRAVQPRQKWWRGLLAQGVSISGDGRYIAFSVRSPTLLGSTYTQVLVIDRFAPDTLIWRAPHRSRAAIPGVGNGDSSFPKLSDDGRYVLFATTAANLTGNVAIPVHPRSSCATCRARHRPSPRDEPMAPPCRPPPGSTTPRHCQERKCHRAGVPRQRTRRDGQRHSRESQVYVAPRP